MRRRRPNLNTGRGRITSILIQLSVSPYIGNLPVTMNRVNSNTVCCLVLWSHIHAQWHIRLCPPLTSLPFHSKNTPLVEDIVQTREYMTPSRSTHQQFHWKWLSASTYDTRYVRNYDNIPSYILAALPFTCWYLSILFLKHLISFEPTWNDELKEVGGHT